MKDSDLSVGRSQLVENRAAAGGAPTTRELVYYIFVSTLS